MARAGLYSDWIVFERKTGDQKDEFGSPTDRSWADLFKRWGRVTGARGKERIAAGRIEGPAPATLRLRYEVQLETVTVDDRVRVGARIYAITAPGVYLRNSEEIEFALESGGAVK